MKKEQLSILFICHANICRSPIARAVFDKILLDAGFGEKVKTDSAGISNHYAGQDADSRTKKAMKENGIPLNHTARQFSEIDFDTFDFILAMDSSNIAAIHEKFPEKAEAFGDRLTLIRSFDLITDSPDVPDPYAGKYEDFEKVYRICYRCGIRFLKYLKQECGI